MQDGWLKLPSMRLELQMVQCNEVAAKVRGTYRRATRQTRSGAAGKRGKVRSTSTGAALSAVAFEAQ